MDFPSLVAGSLTVVYGLLNALAGFSQLKARQIRPRSAGLMLASGLLLLTSGVALALAQPVGLYVLLAGLIAIHILTILNGLHLHGKLNPGHHLFRFAISVALVTLALWSIR